VAVEIHHEDGIHTGRWLQTQRHPELPKVARKEAAEARDEADLDQECEFLLSRRRL
jgi:hypothetical protein